jgi:hypothetical protein
MSPFLTLVSGFFGNDFAVFPDVNGRAVHAGGLAGDFSGSAQGSADRIREFLASSRSRGPFHGDLSNNFGAVPELSYTLHASAKSR